MENIFNVSDPISDHVFVNLEEICEKSLDEVAMEQINALFNEVETYLDASARLIENHNPLQSMGGKEVAHNETLSSDYATCSELSGSETKSVTEDFELACVDYENFLFETPDFVHLSNKRRNNELMVLPKPQKPIKYFETPECNKKTKFSPSYESAKSLLFNFEENQTKESNNNLAQSLVFHIQRKPQKYFDTPPATQKEAQNHGVQGKRKNILHNFSQGSGDEQIVVLEGTQTEFSGAVQENSQKS